MITGVLSAGAYAITEWQEVAVFVTERKELDVSLFPRSISQMYSQWSIKDI